MDPKKKHFVYFLFRSRSHAGLETAPAFYQGKLQQKKIVGWMQETDRDGLIRHIFAMTCIY